MESVSAFAPASVGNVGVGFDMLGHALVAVGDTVTLERSATPGIVLERVAGAVSELPAEPARNTALRPLLKMQADFAVEGGVTARIHKGIHLGSGMGGSAASAVAAVVAANRLWSLDLSPEQMLGYALEGESAATGEPHPDNAAPCLFGGLVLTEPGDPPRVTRIPVPEEIRCVLVHPRLRVDTRGARGVLSEDLSLRDHVRQSIYIGGFVAGCFRGDVEQIGRCLVDAVVEPQRAALIPGFDAVKRAALEAGALGASLSGSGPSVFAWAREARVIDVQVAMVEAFRGHDVPTESWVSPVNAPGARLLDGPAPKGD